MNIRHCLLLSFIVLGYWVACAQKTVSFSGKTILDLKMLRVAKICDSLADIDEIIKERIVARKALETLKPGDHKYLSLLYFYLAYTYENSIHDSAVFYYESSLAEARKSNHTTRIVEAANRLVSLYNANESYFRKREVLIEYLVSVLERYPNDKEKAGIYGTLAGYYNTRGLYEKEISYKLLALGIKKDVFMRGKGSSVDTSNLGVAYLSIGESYLALRNPDKAMEYARPSKAFFGNYRNGMCYYFKIMADIYVEKSDLKNVQTYYDSLNTFLNSKPGITDDWGTLIAINLSLSDHYLTKGKADSASLCLAKGVELLRTHPDICIGMQADYLNGKIKVAKRNYKEALGFLNAAAMRKECLGPEIYADLLKSLAECYDSLKDYKNATKVYNEYIPLRDSLYGEAAKQSIANAEAKYQNKEKQQQIERQQSQLILEKRQKTAYFSGLVLLLIISILLVIIYRNKKRTAKLLLLKNRDLEYLNEELSEANASKAKLFSIISHDLRSPVSQIYQFLRLHEHPEILNETEKRQLSSELQRGTKALLETLEDLLLWSKAQMDLFEPHIQPVILSEVVLQGLDLLKLNMEEKRITVNVKINSEAKVFVDSDYLQIVFRNLLHNAIKASPSGESLVIYYNEQNFTLSIENKGNAFGQADYEKTTNTTDLSGLGLKLVRELSRKTHIGILFDTSGGNGTRVNLIFKKA